MRCLRILIRPISGIPTRRSHAAIWKGTRRGSKITAGFGARLSSSRTHKSWDHGTEVSQLRRQEHLRPLVLPLAVAYTGSSPPTRSYLTTVRFLMYRTVLLALVMALTSSLAFAQEYMVE